MVTNSEMTFQECPSVRFGIPANPGTFESLTVNDAVVYIPRSISGLDLRIEVSRFFRLKKLVVEGWRYC